MASYAGVTFEELVDSQGIRPLWAQRAYISERLVPFGNKEIVQSAGRGNFRISVPVQVTGAGNIATLQAAVGATGRTLTGLFGTTYSNVLLVGVENPQRMNTANDWRATLTFVREGS